MQSKTADPLTVESYIGSFSPALKSKMQKLRKVIKAAAPGAEELISYKMPAYKLGGRPLVYFAAYENHIGFYATPTGHEAFKKELSIYKTGKGSVQFPNDQPFPYDLVTRIVKFRAGETEKQTAAKKPAAKKAVKKK